VNEVQLGGEYFSVDFMFTGRMIMKLRDIVADPIQLDVTPWVIIYLDSMPIVQDVHFTWLVVKDAIREILLA
jgi:hypothetical protein